MAFIPVSDTAQVRIEGRVDNQQTINDLYFRHSTGAIAQADIQALASAMATWYGGSMCPLLNEAWQGVATHARDLSSELGFVADQSMVGTNGTVTGEAAPNNCTMSVSIRSAFPGRSFRGRNYVPVLTNSQVTGNNIDADWAQSVVDAYALLLFGGGALPGGWVWVVVSRFSGGLPRPDGVFSEVFSVRVVDLVVDSQRRRLPGRGK